jgi:hypothetical protein
VRVITDERLTFANLETGPITLAKLAAASILALALYPVLRWRP